MSASPEVRAFVMHSLQIGLIISLNMTLLLLTTPREVASSKKITIVFGGIFLSIIVGVLTADHFHITKEIVWAFLTTAATMAWLGFRCLLAIGLIAFCVFVVVENFKNPAMTAYDRFMATMICSVIAVSGTRWLAGPIIDSIMRTVAGA